MAINRYTQFSPTTFEDIRLYSPDFEQLGKLLVGRQEEYDNLFTGMEAIRSQLPSGGYRTKKAAKDYQQEVYSTLENLTNEINNNNGRLRGGRLRMMQEASNILNSDAYRALKADQEASAEFSKIMASNKWNKSAVQDIYDFDNNTFTQFSLDDLKQGKYNPGEAYKHQLALEHQPKYQETITNAIRPLLHNIDPNSEVESTVDKNGTPILRYRNTQGSIETRDKATVFGKLLQNDGALLNSLYESGMGQDEFLYRKGLHEQSNPGEEYGPLEYLKELDASMQGQYFRDEKINTTYSNAPGSSASRELKVNPALDIASPIPVMLGDPSFTQELITNLTPEEIFHNTKASEESYNYRKLEVQNNIFNDVKEIIGEDSEFTVDIITDNGVPRINISTNQNNLSGQQERDLERYKADKVLGEEQRLQIEHAEFNNLYEYSEEFINTIGEDLFEEVISDFEPEVAKKEYELFNEALNETYGSGEFINANSPRQQQLQAELKALMDSKKSYKQRSKDKILNTAKQKYGEDSERYRDIEKAYTNFENKLANSIQVKTRNRLGYRIIGKDSDGNNMAKGVNSYLTSLMKSMVSDNPNLIEFSNNGETLNEDQRGWLSQILFAEGGDGLENLESRLVYDEIDGSMTIIAGFFAAGKDGGSGEKSFGVERGKYFTVREGKVSANNFSAQKNQIQFIIGDREAEHIMELAGMTRDAQAYKKVKDMDRNINKYNRYNPSNYEYDVKVKRNTLDNPNSPYEAFIPVEGGDVRIQAHGSPEMVNKLDAIQEVILKSKAVISDNGIPYSRGEINEALTTMFPNEFNREQIIDNVIFPAINNTLPNNEFVSASSRNYSLGGEKSISELYKDNAKFNVPEEDLVPIEGMTPFDEITGQGISSPYIHKDVSDNFNSLLTTLGIPKSDVSGLSRTIDYNNSLKMAVKGSAHTKGKAVDFKITDETMKLTKDDLEGRTLRETYGIKTAFVHGDHVHLEFN